MFYNEKIKSCYVECASESVWHELLLLIPSSKGLNENINAAKENFQGRILWKQRLKYKKQDIVLTNFPKMELSFHM